MYSLEKNNDKLRSGFAVESGRVFTFNNVCDQCGQKYPDATISEHRENFERKK